MTEVQPVHGVNSAHGIVFFVSTGRCGTQWFAEKLAAHYSGLAVAAHEPLHIPYQPWAHFRAYNSHREEALSPEVERHLKSVEDVAQRSHYVETGWPSYGALPRIISRFRTVIKVVHLYRHPAAVSRSLASHNVYDRREWSQAMAIHPTDHGVSQGHLTTAVWDGMYTAEKCLFWRTEVNDWALRLRRMFEDVPWLSLAFERVFGGDSDSALCGFLEFVQLPERSAFLDSRREVVDRFHSGRGRNLCLEAIGHCPKAVTLMEALGYATAEQGGQCRS